MVKERKKKYQLSDEDYLKIETMSQIRLRIEQIAIIIGIPKATFERMMRRDKRLSDAIEKGRSRGSMKVTRSAFDQAISGKNPAMTMFWLKTQERWRETDRIELTGADGGPIEHSKLEMTPDQRAARIAYLEGIRKRLKKEPNGS